ncbi:MAG: inositol monophosphatase [Alphaproteobacteria bacterium]|nr:inositol monophosphatase [Alphaproteobacteria bacterium]MBU0797056.1 inositol monophosphatase [Alphaproteobacteria bacterium]MBU0887864.1 inositol monophosphatase [Alphaproteobacteria bacterium]MBU1814913.1 inositol monophosphatase [Alphaproteobacteria bacterium]MBU2089987.1 inositol monophosphatase [Alphaproteobacteria bacterium]
MLIDTDRVSELLRETAETIILPRFRRLEEGDTQEKGPGDLVTVADLESEKFLTPALSRLLPGSHVVGEEAASASPHLLDLLRGDDPVWIIDPVDGTANFAEGSEMFAVMVALARRGEILAGWIYDPIRDRMAVAEAGEGAYLDDRRMSVSRPQPLADMIGTLSLKFVPTEERPEIRARAQNLRRFFSLGCAGHEYLQLTEGRTHFSVYRRIMPWDHAAGWLLHKEAGGVGAFADGTPYAPTIHAGPLIMASDPASWDALRDLLFPNPASRAVG